MATDWMFLPDIDLTDRGNWRSLGNNHYATLRLRLLIVHTNGRQSRYGPIISAHNIGPVDEITLKRKRQQVISRTETISEAVRFATSSCISDQLTAKLSSELSTKVPGFTGKLQSEIVAKNKYEIKEELEKILSGTRSYLIQELAEDEHVITLKPSGSQREAQLRLRYWPRQWDVYLYSYDYLQLSYRNSWFWWQVRKTIKRTRSGPLGWPLGRVTYYEPQPEIVVCYEPIQDEVETPETIHVHSFLAKMPPISSPPAERDLELLARLAFPVTKEEKLASGAGYMRAKPSAKPAKKKKPPKRKPKKRPGAEARGRKKHVRKIGMNKAGRR